MKVAPTVSRKVETMVGRLAEKRVAMKVVSWAERKGESSAESKASEKVLQKVALTDATKVQQ